MRRYSKKALGKRREERECLSEFFSKHVEISKGIKCEECGDRLYGDVSEIAHILPKQTFKSIMCLDDNVLYLCGRNSKNQCHSNYDNFSNEKVKDMNIFVKVSEKFQELKRQITEKINYKITDRYE